MLPYQEHTKLEIYQVFTMIKVFYKTFFLYNDIIVIRIDMGEDYEKNYWTFE